MKSIKIIVSCITLFVLCFTFCINVFAVVEPTNPLQLMYTIPIKNNTVNTYGVWSHKTEMNFIPDSLNKQGLCTTFDKEYRKNGYLINSISLLLQDGSVLYMSSANVGFETIIDLKTSALNSEVYNSHTLCILNEVQDAILMFNQDCNLVLYVYNFNTNEIVNTVLLSSFYCNVFPQNATPEIIYEDAYNKGYTDAQSSSGTFTQEDLDKAFNDGKILGQDTNVVIDTAFNGFFEGIGSFFSQFLKLGIGNLTVYTLLSLAVIACIIMIIVNIIRR